MRHTLNLWLAGLSWTSNLAECDDLLTHVKNAEIIIKVVLALHVSWDIGCDHCTRLQWVTEEVHDLSSHVFIRSLT